VLTDYPAEFGRILGSTRRNHSYREAMVTIWKIAEGDTTTSTTLGWRLIQLHATKTQNPILSSSSTKNHTASMENKKIGEVPTCPLCLLSLFFIAPQLSLSGCVVRRKNKAKDKVLGFGFYTQNQHSM
jgi:hypothetical protein